MINNTQFGYIVDDSGKPIAKYVLPTGEHPLREGYTFIECENEDAMHAQFAAARASTTTVAEAQAKQKSQAINAIQGILDAKANELGFDTIHTAAAWVTSKNPARKARADALVAWGDAVWDFAEAEWEKQVEGKGTFTTVDEFLGALPKFPGVIG